MKIGQFNPVSEHSKFTDHSGRAPLLRPLTARRAPLLVADSLVQNLPDQAAKPMGNQSDRLLVPQARYIPAVEDLEDASFILDRGIGRLVEKAPQTWNKRSGIIGLMRARSRAVRLVCGPFGSVDFQQRSADLLSSSAALLAWPSNTTKTPSERDQLALANLKAAAPAMYGFNTA
jgi:hypothetical protein